jgi:cell division protein FtsI (penicillin-binding protein 3)
MLVVTSLGFGAVAVRLADVQVVSASRYATFGQSQRLVSVLLPAQRGSILDRNGAELAISARAKTVWANPKLVRDPAGAAARLAPVLGADESVLRDRLSSDAAFVYLARKVDDAVATEVEALDIPGVAFLDEPRRHEPAGGLAAGVLGSVGVDDEGLSGLELLHDKELAGTPGELLVERDPTGADIAAGVHELRPPRSGRQVAITIDREMQFETERALADQVAATKAKGGIAIVMDPRTGEILAMANLLAAKGGDGRKGAAVPSADNMAVTRVYEPGSVNKVITIAAALEEGVVQPSQRMTVPDTLKVADVTFKDDESHSPGWWSVAEIMAHSSNVGTIMIGQQLGRDRIDRYLRQFGLGTRTALEFPGESGGILLDADEWSGTSIGTVPIGQGLAVTALQMLGPYNAIANGGVSVAPTLLKSLTDASGRPQPVPEPERRRVVSPGTAETVTRLLVGAVAKGTGTAARIDRYTVAGKTGTAGKPRDDAPGYAPGAYVASFVGFLPAEAPRLSAIVVLDEPTPYYGGLAAAPVFATLAAYGVRHFGVPAPSAPPAPLAAAPSPVTLGTPPASTP